MKKEPFNEAIKNIEKVITEEMPEKAMVYHLQEAIRYIRLAQKDKRIEISNLNNIIASYERAELERLTMDELDEMW